MTFRMPDLSNVLKIGNKPPKGLMLSEFICKFAKGFKVSVIYTGLLFASLIQVKSLTLSRLDNNLFIRSLNLNF